jgi:hypothetical protein
MKNRLALLLAASAVIATAPANAQQRNDRADRQVEIVPYVELDQTVFTQFKGRGETLTYTSAAVGLDTRIKTRRIELQLDYRYEYRFGWGRQPDSSINSGLARGRYTVVPNLLNIEAGAIASRLRGNAGGDLFNPLIGETANVSQLYSAYVGPAVSTNIGDLGISGAYRFGYTKVDRGLIGAASNAGLAGFDSFNSSVSHTLLGSVGMRSGALPFGWTVSAGYDRDDATQLDQRYEGKNVRADVTLPVSPTLALVGGGGYEDIEATQRDALIDPNTRLPVVDNRGRLQTDPASPRRLAYSTSGFIWDAGVSWRPNARASGEFRVGRRYGDWSFTGTASYAVDEWLAFRAQAYDGIQTFGRQISNSLSGLPTQFDLPSNAFNSPVAGCVFGASGAQGFCFDPALQSISSSVYRSRGVNTVFRYIRNRWQFGGGVGYARRRFFAPVNPGIFSLDGVTDQTLFGQLYFGRSLSEASGVNLTLGGSWTSNDLAGSSDILGTSAIASYFRQFGERLRADASLALYSSKIEGLETTLTGAAQLGARYSF